MIGQEQLKRPLFNTKTVVSNVNAVTAEKTRRSTEENKCTSYSCKVTENNGIVGCTIVGDKHWTYQSHEWFAS